MPFEDVDFKLSIMDIQLFELISDGSTLGFITPDSQSTEV
jgi:hypothetical protein